MLYTRQNVNHGWKATRIRSQKRGVCYWTVEKVRLSSAVAKPGLSCVHEELLYKKWQLLVRMDWKYSRSLLSLAS